MGRKGGKQNCSTSERITICLASWISAFVGHIIIIHGDGFSPCTIRFSFLLAIFVSNIEDVRCCGQKRGFLFVAFEFSNLSPMGFRINLSFTHIRFLVSHLWNLFGQKFILTHSMLSRFILQVMDT